jgi:kinesin family protein 3/17
MSAGAGGGASTDETVKVAVRCRPPNSKEEREGRKNCVDVNGALGQVAIRNPADPSDVKTFTFDNVYDPDSIQKSLYEETAFPLVENVLSGYNGTIFACECHDADPACAFI